MSGFRNSQNCNAQFGEGSATAIFDAYSSRIGGFIPGVGYRVTSSTPLHLRSGDHTVEATTDDLLIGGPNIVLEFEPYIDPLRGNFTYVSATAPSGQSGYLYVGCLRGW